MDLVEFLTARLGEDERAARLMAEHYPAPWDVYDRGYMARVMADEPNFREVTQLEQWPEMPAGEDAPWLGEIIEHIARHDPARVMREVEAKRRIIDEHRPPRSIALVSVDRELGTRTAADDGTTRCRVCTSMDGHGAARFAGPCPTLQLLALPYADHPDCRQEWKP